MATTKGGLNEDGRAALDPVPYLPNDPAALIELVRQMTDAQRAELRALLAVE